MGPVHGTLGAYTCQMEGRNIFCQSSRDSTGPYIPCINYPSGTDYHLCSVLDSSNYLCSGSRNQLHCVATNPVTVKSFSPTTASPGALITVTGENLGLIQSVTINGDTSSFSVSKDGTNLLVTVPNTSSGPLVLHYFQEKTVTAGTINVISPPEAHTWLIWGSLALLVFFIIVFIIWLLLPEPESKIFLEEKTDGS